jgi:uncharacterized Fe-S center protein
MKKVLAIAFIAATMVACNNESKNETPTVDSVAIKAAADSVAAAQAAAAAAAADTMNKAATDTLPK